MNIISNRNLAEAATHIAAELDPAWRVRSVDVSKAFIWHHGIGEPPSARLYYSPSRAADDSRFALESTAAQVEAWEAEEAKGAEMESAILRFAETSEAFYPLDVIVSIGGARFRFGLFERGADDYDIAGIVDSFIAPQGREVETAFVGYVGDVIRSFGAEAPEVPEERILKMRGDIVEVMQSPERSKKVAEEIRGLAEETGSDSVQSTLREFADLIESGSGAA